MSYHELEPSSLLNLSLIIEAFRPIPCNSQGTVITTIVQLNVTFHQKPLCCRCFSIVLHILIQILRRIYIDKEGISYYFFLKNNFSLKSNYACISLKVLNSTL